MGINPEQESSTPDLDPKQKVLLETAEALAECESARHETYYTKRKMTFRERAAYRIGHLAGKHSGTQTPGTPDAIADGMVVCGRTDYTRVHLGYIGDLYGGVTRYLDITESVNHITGEQQKRIELVDEESATNTRAATDYSAQITEVSNRIDLLQPLDPQEVLLVQRQFDETLAYAEAVQRS